jgi:erythromycin esterase-like protein
VIRHLRRARGDADALGLLSDLRARARPLRSPADLDPLLERVGDARCVLLGEASHGTHEYYAWRAEISKRLIFEKGFRFIAVEGDWPDCYRVNRFVKGYPDSGKNAREVLHAFERWPTWMWANEEIVELAGWLRSHNDGLPAERKVGFYGLDVYSLWDSLYQVASYLRKKGGEAAEAARRALQCFEPYGEDEQEYAHASRWIDETCEQEVVSLLQAVRAAAPAHPGDGREAHFVAEQNALVIQNAETYYRAMVLSGPESWNVRDRHVDETLARLLSFHGPEAKAIVWEHNTHVGDARYTDMLDDDMVNLGQLARERYGEDDVVLVGFGSYAGGVIAGDAWGAPMRRMTVPPARPNSWEELMHRAGAADKLLLFDPSLDSSLEWLEPRGHRAIGVVYRPDYERRGNYVPTVLPHRYDAFLYLDRTQALRPLHLREAAQREAPETFPSGV